MADMTFDPAGWFGNLVDGINQGLDWADDNIFAPIGNAFNTAGEWLDNKLTGNRDRARYLEDEQRKADEQMRLAELQRSWNLADRAHAEERADFEWERSLQAANTAVQRHAADLLAAGLNPALAASGTGASVPSAGSASGFSGSNSIPSRTSGAYHNSSGNVSELIRLASTAVNVAGMILL